MTRSRLSKKSAVDGSNNGFSLIEVVLAIGILLVTVLALVGLLGPTLQSVDEVEKTDEVASIVNTLNAFLQSSPEIAPSGVSRFDTIYNAVQGAVSPGYATIFFFRAFTTSSSAEVEIKIGFLGETDAQLVAADFDNIAGPVYRVVLTASSVTPITHLNNSDSDGDGHPDRDANGVFTLSSDLATYDEGYFAMEVQIYQLESDTTSSIGGVLPDDIGLEDLLNEEPLFTYNAAVVR